MRITHLPSTYGLKIPPVKKSTTITNSGVVTRTVEKTSNNSVSIPADGKWHSNPNHPDANGWITHDNSASIPADGKWHSNSKHPDANGWITHY